LYDHRFESNNNTSNNTMEPLELLNNTKATPGVDQSWLEFGWLGRTCLSLETRAGIVDWLVQCQQYLGLSDCCLHSAVANFDLVLSRVDWDVSELQLVALASLQLAAKMEEDAAPAPSLLLPLAGGVYDKADLARTELEMFQALDWNLRGTTAATFVEMFYAVAGKGRKPLFKMAKAILDLCLYKDWYGQEQPSQLAASCLATAAHLTGQLWCEQLQAVTGSCEEGLANGVRMVMAACVTNQCEGFSEKHGKCGRNLVRLEAAIRSLLNQPNNNGSRSNSSGIGSDSNGNGSNRDDGDVKSCKTSIIDSGPPTRRASTRALV